MKTQVNKPRVFIEQLVNNIKNHWGCEQVVFTPLIGKANPSIEWSDDGTYGVVTEPSGNRIVYYRATKFQRPDSLIIKLAEEHDVPFHPREVPQTFRMVLDFNKLGNLLDHAAINGVGVPLTLNVSRINVVKLCRLAEIDDPTVNKIPAGRFNDDQRRVWFDISGEQTKRFYVKGLGTLDFDSQTGRVWVVKMAAGVDAAIIEFKVKEDNNGL